MSVGRVRLISDDGTVLDRFEEYRIRQDVRQMGASFVLTVAPLDDLGMDRVEYLNTKPEVQIEVDGTALITGRVGQCRCVDDREEGSYANIVGEDLLGVAAKSSLPRGFSVANLSVTGSIAAALARYQLPIIGSNDANRDLIGHRVARVPDGTPVMTWQDLGYNEQGERVSGWAPTDVMSYRYHLDTRTSSYVRDTKEITITDQDERELQPQPGERIGSWIARVCEEHRLLVWLTADGSVFVGRPRYDQVNIPRIIVGGSSGEGSVERAEWNRSPIDQFATIEVCGRVGSTGDSNVIGTATDADLLVANWQSYRLETDDGLRDLACANDRAARILHDQQLEGDQLHVTLSGHGILDALPAPDMMFHYTHPRFRLERDLYCIARDFVKSRKRGTVCDLTLVRPNLLAA